LELVVSSGCHVSIWRRSGAVGWSGAYVRAASSPLRKKVFGKVRASFGCSLSVPVSRRAQRKRFLNFSRAARRGVPSTGALCGEAVFSVEAVDGVVVRDRVDVARVGVVAVVGDAD